ncbi:MAG TPA: hypothetical protein PKE31_16845 [Pseudomonadota bacterium]|nr:hypothetical protein [Pseudomonadota bacterium]
MPNVLASSPMSFLRNSFSFGQKTWHDANRRLRTLEEDVKARGEADFSGMANGLRARLVEQLELTDLPIDADLRQHALPLGVAEVSASAYRSPKVRKIVMSHVLVGASRLPAIEGLALTVFPEYEWDLPCFAADFLAFPWSVSVHADVYGREWQTQKVLSSLQHAFLRLGSGPGPVFCASLASGDGLHARLRPRQMEEGFAALLQALKAYLDLFADPPPGRSQSAQQEVFAVFHEAGPKKRLRRLFGEAFAERYSRLLFE